MADDDLPAPLPIQIVFQGGGARLCTLMAICEVLQQNDGKELQITRVAGASAGAIAAVMLATGTEMEVYKERLKRLGPRYVSLMKATGPFGPQRGALRVISGEQYFDKLELIDFFEELFPQADGGQLLLNGLKFEPKLYSTDLYTLGPSIAKPEEAVPKALARSCRFPLAFSGFKSGDFEVDGGLAMNLPVDGLQADHKTHGTVIGIGFKSDYGAARNKNLLSYTQQLFSAAIESGVTRSEMMLTKANMYRAATDIGTFEFEEALTRGLDADYKAAKGAFEKWLADWIAPRRPVKKLRDVHAEKLIRPLLSDTARWGPAVIRAITDGLKAKPCTHSKSISLFDTAMFDAQGKFTGNYRSRSAMRFKIVRETSILQFSFQTGRGGDFVSANLGCAVTDENGRSLTFRVHVEELEDDGGEVRSYRVYFLFDAPLLPSEVEYFLEYQYEAPDPYAEFGERIEISSLTQFHGDAEEVMIGVAFPRANAADAMTVRDLFELSEQELDLAKYEKDDLEEIIPSAKVPLGEYQEKMNLDLAIKHYYIVCRKARDVKRNQTIGFSVA